MAEHVEQQRLLVQLARQLLGTAPTTLAWVLASNGPMTAAAFSQLG